MPNGNSHHATLREAEPSFEPLLDLAQAAGLLRIHPQTLKKMAIRRAVPAINAISSVVSAPAGIVTYPDLGFPLPRGWVRRDHD